MHALSALPVDLQMEMGAARVARHADRPEDVAGLHDVTLANGHVAQVSVNGEERSFRWMVVLNDDEGTENRVLSYAMDHPAADRANRHAKGQLQIDTHMASAELIRIDAVLRKKTGGIIEFCGDDRPVLLAIAEQFLKGANEEIEVVQRHWHKFLPRQLAEGAIPLRSRIHY